MALNGKRAIVREGFEPLGNITEHPVTIINAQTENDVATVKYDEDGEVRQVHKSRIRLA
jgi:hypothetical protein